MKKALSGGLLGLFIGGAVMLFFAWVDGIISFRLIPLRIESSEFTPQVALMLFQCLLTGAIAGGITYLSGHWGLGAIAGVVVGYGLGFILVGQYDHPWGTIGALAMLVPLVFVGVLSSLISVVVRTEDSISTEKEPIA
jgi:hypothetical protein